VSLPSTPPFRATLDVPSEASQGLNPKVFQG